VLQHGITLVLIVGIGLSLVYGLIKFVIDTTELFQVRRPRQPWDC